MVKVLAEHKQALEVELRERIQAFFKANDERPESVSISMKLAESGTTNNLSTIDILIKDASAGSLPIHG